MDPTPRVHPNTRQGLKDFINAWHAEHPNGDLLEIYTAVIIAGFSPSFLLSTPPATILPMTTAAHLLPLHVIPPAQRHQSQRSTSPHDWRFDYSREE